MIPHHVAYPIVCVYCKGGEFAHNPVNGACNAYRRAEHPPVVYRARPQAAASGWRWER